MTESLFKIPKWESGDGYDATAAVNAIYKAYENQKTIRDDAITLFNDMMQKAQKNTVAKIKDGIDELSIQELQDPTIQKGVRELINATSNNLGGLNPELKDEAEKHLDTDRFTTLSENYIKQQNHQKLVDTEKQNEFTTGVNNLFAISANVNNTFTPEQVTNANARLKTLYANVADPGSGMTDVERQAVLTAINQNTINKAEQINNISTLNTAVFNHSYGGKAKNYITASARSRAIFDVLSGLGDDIGNSKATRETLEKSITELDTGIATWLKTLPKDMQNEYHKQYDKTHQDAYNTAYKQVLELARVNVSEFNALVSQQNVNNNYVLGSERNDIRAAEVALNGGNGSGNGNVNPADSNSGSKVVKEVYEKVGISNPVEYHSDGSKTINKRNIISQINTHFAGVNAYTDKDLDERYKKAVTHEYWVGKGIFGGASRGTAATKAWRDVTITDGLLGKPRKLREDEIKYLTIHAVESNAMGAGFWTSSRYKDMDYIKQTLDEYNRGILTRQAQDMQALVTAIASDMGWSNVTVIKELGLDKSYSHLLMQEDLDALNGAKALTNPGKIPTTPLNPLSRNAPVYNPNPFNIGTSTKTGNKTGNGKPIKFPGPARSDLD